MDSRPWKGGGKKGREMSLNFQEGSPASFAGGEGTFKGKGEPRKDCELVEKGGDNRSPTFQGELKRAREGLPRKNDL